MIKIKKLRKINETEKRTDIILDDPKFRNWFKGSKVVDSNGKPLVCFHGTKITFDSFRPLSHFGTINASNNFVFSDYDEYDIENASDLYDRKDNITPVYLSIKNPLKMEDENFHSWTLGFDMYAQGFITYNELLDVYDNKRQGKNLDRELQQIINVLLKFTPNLEIDKINFAKYFTDGSCELNTKKFISIFKKKGYDGMVYKNKAEDIGSISWIIFDSNQVWPIFKNSED